MKCVSRSDCQSLLQAVQLLIATQESLNSRSLKEQNIQGDGSSNLDNRMQIDPIQVSSISFFHNVTVMLLSETYLLLVYVCDYHTASSCGVVLLYINFKNADSPKNLQHKRKGFLTAKFSLIYMKRILSNWVFTHICTLWGCNSILSILLKRTKMPVMAPKLLHTWILDCYASSLNIRTQNPEK